MMTDRIVLERALAAARVNVKGTLFERAKPRSAEEADRTPNWDKWLLIPEPALWQCVALSLKIDPDKVRPGKWEDKYLDPDKPCLDKWYWYGGPVFDEGPEFDDRLYIARENLHRTLRGSRVGVDSPLQSRVNLREFAVWVRQIGRAAPPELLAMADEQVARAGSGKCTDAATAKREAKKAGRWADLKRFIADVYTALDKDGLNIGEDGNRNPLPVSKDDLYTLFRVRHPEHNVAQSTFDDDLGKIVTFKSGQKRYDIKKLAEILAGKFSG